MSTLVVGIAACPFASGNDVRNVCAGLLLAGGFLLLAFAFRLLRRAHR